MLRNFTSKIFYKHFVSCAKKPDIGDDPEGWSEWFKNGHQANDRLRMWEVAVMNLHSVLHSDGQSFWFKC